MLRTFISCYLVLWYISSELCSFPQRGLLHIFLIFFFIYFGLCWVFVATRAFSLVSAGRSYSLVAVPGLSVRWRLLLPGAGSRRAGFGGCGSWALACGLRGRGAAAHCSAPRRIFPDRLCLLHWRADPLLLSHREAPTYFLRFIDLSVLFWGC